MHPQKDRRWRCIFATGSVGSRFARVLVLFGRVWHFFALDDEALLPVEDGVPPTLVAEVEELFCDIVVLDGVIPVDVTEVDGKGVLMAVELEEAGEGTLPPNIISDAFAQNAMRRSTLST